MEQAPHGTRDSTAGSAPSGGASSRRCLAVWLGVTVLCWSAAALCLQTGLTIWSALGDHGSFEDVLVLAGAAAGTLSLTWLWAVASLTVASAALGRVRSSPDLPAGLVRRTVLALCGVALTAAVAAPAQAGPGAEADVAGLPYPDRASITLAQPAPPTGTATARPAAVAAPAPHHTHVVRPGDTLWSVAAATLPGSASDARIDARWREIHRLNRATLGRDPHLIHPDQVLILPTTHEGDR